ncbi:alpha/beta hydrolase [Arcanobacterium haemolyticum]|nr:alpha/beta hydrolase [Arcanobacterium haemolyticum]
MSMKISAPVPDYIGSTWEARTIFLSDDDGGAPSGRSDVAVIVHEKDAPDLIATSGTAALYLHGFQDSFFHTEQASMWREESIPLIGLDFRRSGRALRSEKSRDDIRDIYVREEEIGTTIEYIRRLGARRIVLIGHSTGGLQAALWAADHPESVDVVILNSPWLDHNGSEFQRTTLTKFVDYVGRVAPRAVIARLKPDYARSLHQNFGGEFSFDPAHKVLYPVGVYAGFFRTVLRAQARIARGEVRISQPLLVAHSDRSGNFLRPSAEDLASSDVVLNVEDMKRLSRVLSPDVEFLEIPGGRHDLALSQRPARELYGRETVAWAVRKLAGLF